MTSEKNNTADQRGWQHIETAPKDGTVFLALGAFPLSGQPWHYECMWNGFEWYHGFGDAWPEAKPTWWRNLPSPPGLTGVEDSSAGDQPTDADIVALLGDTKFSSITAAREALRRWGTKAAVQAEPVAWMQKDTWESILSDPKMFK